MARPPARSPRRHGSAPAGPAPGRPPPDPRVWRVHGDPLLPPTGPGPLTGLLVAVKDLFAVTGHPVGAGNPAWLDGAPVAAADAAAVAALRTAGAAVAGIARTDELAFSLSGTNHHYGTPPNPAAPRLVPGGSTSGPAAAVALGQADVGLGTDTAGSIRVPASCCGLYGLRPTHGAVPACGLVGLAPSFDTVGWLARDAAALRAVGEVLLAPAVAPRALPARLVLTGALLAGVPAEVSGLVRAAARRAAEAWGVELDERSPSWGERLPDLLAAFRAVQAAQAWRLHGDWIRAHPGALAPDVEERFRLGASIGHDEERTASAALRDWREQLLADLDDCWLAAPAAGGPAHGRAADPAAKDTWRAATLRVTVAASAAGLPSLVAPAAQAGAEPVGWAVIGPPGADLAMLGAAAQL